MSVYVQIALDLGLAWLIGSLIGLEREFRGRPAGFRTHALVCVASALLMLATVHQSIWVEAAGLDVDTVQTDPTRMAQGIMTGIGFLGAGVIFKEGLSIRGLTTAASIWTTAAIGILVGVGFRYTALLGALVALATLSLFQLIEARMPAQLYAHLRIRFARAGIVGEAELRRMLAEQGFKVSGASYRLSESDASYEYQLVVSTQRRADVRQLAEHLRGWDAVREFSLSMTGE